MRKGAAADPAVAPVTSGVLIAGRPLAGRGDDAGDCHAHLSRQDSRTRHARPPRPANWEPHDLGGRLRRLRRQIADNSDMAMPSPCRLTIFLARERPLAAVLRRGPSAWARLNLWHTDSDAFEHGQWFHARVYERRSDISADGSMFVYFAQRTARLRRLTSPRSRGSRSASRRGSRPSRLLGDRRHVLHRRLLPESGSLYLGGIVDEPDKGRLPSGVQLTSEHPPYSERDTDWPGNRVYFSRLLRDGWRPLPQLSHPRAWWEHMAPEGQSALVMMPQKADFTSYGGYHAADYAVRDTTTGTVENLGPATWADWDQQGRLVLAQNGRLLAWQRARPQSCATQRPAPRPAALPRQRA